MLHKPDDIEPHQYARSDNRFLRQITKGIATNPAWVALCGGRQSHETAARLGIMVALATILWIGVCGFLALEPVP